MRGAVVDLRDAEAHLSGLLARVGAGEEIVIARGGVPAARLVPIRDGGERALGFVGAVIPELFWETLPKDELDSWS